MSEEHVSEPELEKPVNPPGADSAPSPGREVSEASPGYVHQMELVVSSILRFGVILSFGVILVGSILFFVEGGPEVVVRLTGTPTPKVPRDIIAQAFQLQPKAIIDLGLFLLIATPVARVAVAVVAFLIEADLIFVLVTLYVLAVLLLSFVLGRAG